MKLYLTSSYSRFSFENPFEFIRTKAGKLLLTALSHLLYLSTFFLSPSLFLYSSSSFCLSSSSHFHSLHGFSLLPVLQEKKAVPQTRSLFNVLFQCTLIQSLFCICAHYSFTIFSCLLPFFTTNWYNVAVPVFSVVSVLHVFSVIFGQLY